MASARDDREEPGVVVVGQPIFNRGGARLEDALSMFRAGESLDVVADEYGVPREHLEDVVRIATRVAA